MIKTKFKSYVDITLELTKEATPNSHKVKEQLYFDCFNYRYYVDNHFVVLDYSKKELEIAYWLEKKFGGEIYMLPRINYPEGIKTPDYLWNNEYWDLKCIKTYSSQSLYHLALNSKRQCCNFIFDVTGINLSREEVIIRVEKLYNRPDTLFVNKIIIKSRNYFLAFKRM